MSGLTIVPAAPGDLDAMMALFDGARRFMAQGGNAGQWVGGYPQRELVEADIARGEAFLCRKNGRLCGTFVLSPGPDEAYAVIDGAWKNDRPYASIHRLAGDGETRGLFAAVLAFCEARWTELRADTHPDNRIVRHLLEKHGFSCCGVITHSGRPFLAFQKSAATGTETRRLS